MNAKLNKIVLKKKPVPDYFFKRWSHPDTNI
jgi:hypothetical protein